jgi:hypothetical protein
MNGTDEDMLWNDSEEVGNVRSECEADEDSECKGRQSDTVCKGRYNMTCFVC